MITKDKIDFPLNLQGVKIDTAPKTFYLSIVVFLDKNNTGEYAVKEQKKLLKNIESAQEIVGSGIYRYPKKDIHFTIMYFEGLSSVLETEESFEENRKKHIEEVKQVFKNLKKDFKELKKNDVEFSYVYTKNTESLAIQAFPCGELMEFFGKMERKLGFKAMLKPVKFKVYGKGRFATNLVRFFRELSNAEYDFIANNISKINKKCDNKGKNKKKILFKMKLQRISFVVSDNWMSNEFPERFPMNL